MINYNGTKEKWKNEGCTANVHITFDTFVNYGMITFFNPHKHLIQLKVHQFKYLPQVFKFSLINTTEKMENICSEYFL